MNKTRKYYFMDYTQLIAMAKKIKGFLDRNKNQYDEFHYKHLGTYLKKKLYDQPKLIKTSDGKAKFLRTSLINNQALVTIRKGFVILRDLGYIRSFDFERLEKQDSYVIKVKFDDNFYAKNDNF